MNYNEIRLKDIPALSFLKENRVYLYLGPKLSWWDRGKIRRVEAQYNVVYTPDLFEGITREKFEYNFPGIPFPESFSYDAFRSRIFESIGEGVSPDSVCFVRFDGTSFVVFDGWESVDEVEEEIEFDFDVSEPIEICCDDIVNYSVCCKEEADISFRVTPSLDPAHMMFSHEMDKAAEEARKAIEGLLMSGFPVEVIKSWLNESVKLSRLRITRQFKILLVDYDREVKMGPLPKTVFLFYLRHPEGVMFSYLQDYKEELRRIYSRVCTSDSWTKIEESVSRLTDPLDNSINEKCAAVKKGFLLQVDDSVAKNYYITGPQGEPKGIALDRSLVEWECEL